jgi:hypothetical protein
MPQLAPAARRQRSRLRIVATLSRGDSFFAVVSAEESRSAETKPPISDGFLSVERECSG